jgi:hypothetical protein
MRAWGMTKALSRPYSEILGLQGLPAYSLDAAVVRWGTSFDAAIQAATSGAKNNGEAERKAQQVIRRWVPSTRKYR